MVWQSVAMPRPSPPSVSGAEKSAAGGVEVVGPIGGGAEGDGAGAEEDVAGAEAGQGGGGVGDDHLDQQAGALRRAEEAGELGLHGL